MESIPLPWNSSSAYGGAAIDADDLAGDVGGRRHTQERHHGCDLRRLPRPAQWNFWQKFLLHDFLRAYRFRHVSYDHAWCDAVHTNSVVGPLGSQASC